jgi:hypothetical protein
MDPRNNGHGKHEARRGPRRRIGLIALGVVAVVALAVAGRSVLTSGSDDDTPGPSTTATAGPSPSQSDEATTSPSASASPTSSPSPEPVLDDGRHFVFALAAATAPPSLRFDLAEFLTDEAAQDAAEEHGDEAVNGYYIVNDNPRLRTLEVADDVRVRYIPIDDCCDLVDGTWKAYVAAVDGDGPADLDPSAPWWITVRDDVIVGIEQQYLP